MDREYQILCLAARTTLDAHVEHRLLNVLQHQVNWERLWEIALLHQVWSLVHASLARLKEGAPIPPAWLERSRQAAYETVFDNALQADQLLRILHALGDAGVDALAVKGVVLAETVYGNVALRPASDIDILIRPQALPQTRIVLQSLGYHHVLAPEFGHLHHALHDPPYYQRIGERDIRVEVHWTLWARHLFPLEPDALWQRAAMVKLRGAGVRTTSPEDTLLHLAIHRSRSSLRLRLVCDIAELLRRHAHGLDWDYLLHTARRGGARTALFASLVLARDLLEAPLPDGVLPRLEISPLKRSLLVPTWGESAFFYDAPHGTARELSLAQRLLILDGTEAVLHGSRYRLLRGIRYFQSLVKGNRAEPIDEA
jgi:hypothetical protein